MSYNDFTFYNDFIIESCDFENGSSSWWVTKYVLVAEEEDSRCHYCLFVKDMAWKHTAYHINNFDPGQVYLKALWP